MKLYLDDKRTPIEDGWEVVRSYGEFIDFITKKGVPEVVSFDHDLADEHYDNTMYVGYEAYNKLYKTFKIPTGLHCAKFLCDYCVSNDIKLPKKINVHSHNPVGCMNITDLLLSVNLLYQADESFITNDKIPFYYVQS